MLDPQPVLAARLRAIWSARSRGLDDVAAGIGRRLGRPPMLRRSLERYLDGSREPTHEVLVALLDELGVPVPERAHLLAPLPAADDQVIGLQAPPPVSRTRGGGETVPEGVAA